ncbi:hypothetical protein PQR14_21135 [Paraburkholderia bryophila]|uniref:hypothetical protein n=1 Tax=Burkholderiaceae TaxID=119060 RepID=UPI00054ECD44|nr:hypothetical protein [Burkholderia sp. 9120]
MGDIVTPPSGSFQAKTARWPFGLGHERGSLYALALRAIFDNCDGHVRATPLARGVKKTLREFA